jgi:adenosine/AMP kinase
MKTIEQIAKAKRRTSRTVRNWLATYEANNDRLGSWQGNARVFSDEEISLFAPAVTEKAEAEPTYEVINPRPVGEIVIDRQAPRTPAPALVAVNIETLNISIPQQDVEALDGQTDALKGVASHAFNALQSVMTEQLVGHIRLAQAQNLQAVAAAQATAATQAVGAIAS